MPAPVSAKTAKKQAARKQRRADKQRLQRDSVKPPLDELPEPEPTYIPLRSLT